MERKMLYSALSVMLRYIDVSMIEIVATLVMLHSLSSRGWILLLTFSPLEPPLSFSKAKFYELENGYFRLGSSQNEKLIDKLSWIFGIVCFPLTDSFLLLFTLLDTTKLSSFYHFLQMFHILIPYGLLHMLQGNTLATSCLNSFNIWSTC